MAGNPQPLDQQFPIVDAQGRPTIYFIQWAQQRQIDISDGLTLTGLEDYLLAHKFTAGNGIGLAPDGDLASSPTITAKVQEILDQLSSTEGSVLYRGAAGWAALAPGAAGRLLQTNGPGADPTWVPAAGGGASYEASPTKPAAASFTLVNGGTGTLADTALGVAALFPSGATDTIHLAQWNTSVASTTFTVTVRLRPTLVVPNGNHYQSCLIIRNSSNDRQVVFGDWTGNTQILVQNWTTNAAFLGNVVAPVTCNTAAFPWRRVVCTAGNMSFEASPDGVTWMSIGTATLASFLTAAGGTADKVGVGTRGVGGDVCYSLVLA